MIKGKTVDLWSKGNIFIMDLLGLTYVEYCVQKINFCAPSAQVLVKNFMNWGFSRPLSCNLLSKLPIDRKSPIHEIFKYCVQKINFCAPSAQVLGYFCLSISTTDLYTRLTDKNSLFKVLSQYGQSQSD